MLTRKGIRKNVKENEAYLTMLEEFDRTGKLRKSNYKERVNFTIDESLMIEFRKFCKSNSMSMSMKIENFIKEFLKVTK